MKYLYKIRCIGTQIHSRFKMERDNISDKLQAVLMLVLTLRANTPASEVRDLIEERARAQVKNNKAGTVAMVERFPSPPVKRTTAHVPANAELRDAQNTEDYFDAMSAPEQMERKEMEGTAICLLCGTVVFSFI